jgi:thiol-disulfide isomerase/thioredoxin
MSARNLIRTITGFLIFVCARQAAQAQQVSVEQMFKYKPVQKDIEVENLAPADLSKCKVEAERIGKSVGWVAIGPRGDGHILRKFFDTDGDNVVDQWRYYLNGLEVYRDIDTNADNDVDQSRWLNTAGTRWGIDSDQDGTIDQWKVISAEEASREAIRAMAAGDAKALAAVLITADDMEALGISAEVAGRLQESVKDPARQIAAILQNSSVIKPTSRWTRFDSSMLMPNTVPAESAVADRDLLVYENVMAYVDNAGETGFVQIGEMVKVGDVWKLTSIPKPLEGELYTAEGGILMQPNVVSAIPVGAEPSPEMKQLIEQLQKLDQAAPKPDSSKSDIAAYNAQRAQLLGKLADVAATNEERQTWKRQQIDQIAAAVQLDVFPNGVEALQAIEADLRAKFEGTPLVPYVVYRRMSSEYNAQLLQADASQRVEIQAAWLAALEQFIKDFPQGEDAADAMLQLAMAQEFAGKVSDAKGWYTKLAESYASSSAGTVAAGALRRLNLKGQTLTLAGPVLGGNGRIDVAQLRGKVVVVLFWATWCRPCTEDLPQLQELYRQHKAAGFEIVGVNVDSSGAPIQEYIQQYKVAWPSIHEEGGLQSGVAQQFGVITLPTTFLVDKAGKVVSSAASVDDLKKQVPELLAQ